MGVSRRSWLSGLLGLAAVATIAAGPPQPAPLAQSGDVVVFAAASLKNALDAINAQWQKETGKKASISYGASSALAKQIEQAAPAQMFISADLDWMDYVAQSNLIKPETRSNLLGNRIVLIAHKDKAQPIDIKSRFRSCQGLGRRPLRDGQRRLGPGRQYGKAALEKLGVWESVSNKIAQAENVRAALALGVARRGTARHRLPDRCGGRPDVKIIGTFPEDTHPQSSIPLP